MVKSFRFDNELVEYNESNPHYILTIIVKEKDDKYYDISYKYKFIECTDSFRNE